jgi:hypothetical protein
LQRVCFNRVQRKSFAATESLQILPLNTENKGWLFIALGNASGEYSGTTNAELRQKLYDLGLKHGAEAMKITGVRLVPEGHIVNMAGYNYIEATDDPDQAFTETDWRETISGDPNAGYTRYRRIMYAEYYRKKLDDKP